MSPRSFYLLIRISMFIGGTTGRYFAKEITLREGEGTRVRFFAILTYIWTIEVE
ncbi:hypothetical protein J2Z65_001924 [Paenibacillus aceris]|uniref:Uncharacterized protein n=1 Tax=Paenibacillus aceris TaxID=869555 RepID=A0ABS4HVX2_9BACL|nr:hypothetical protein [Paenibacillus aceris]